MQLALRARRSLAAVALRRLSAAAAPPVAAAPPPTWLQQCSGLPLIAGQVRAAQLQRAARSLTHAGPHRWRAQAAASLRSRTFLRARRC